MEWGRFLMRIGAIFGTAGCTLLLFFKCVLDEIAPSIVMDAFGLGLGLVMLGGLIIYAVTPKEQK